MDDWTTFAIAEPGYESDTGPRDIPTLSNFETATPVTVVQSVPRVFAAPLNLANGAFQR